MDIILDVFLGNGTNVEFPLTLGYEYSQEQLQFYRLLRTTDEYFCANVVVDSKTEAIIRHEAVGRTKITIMPEAMIFYAGDIQDVLTKFGMANALAVLGISRKVCFNQVFGQ